MMVPPMRPPRSSIAPPSEHPWIDVKHLPVGRERLPGGESILMQFLPKEVWQDYDAILRIDADISFKPDFAQLLATEFERDPEAGNRRRDAVRARGHRVARNQVARVFIRAAR